MQLNTFFTGSKVVGAIPMSHDAFCQYVGRDIDPAELDVTGYLVEYLDGGKANHPGHVGYISWSPSEVFEKNYISIGDITGLAPHVIRLKAERAENFDRLQKLSAFLGLQELLSFPEASRTDEQNALLVKIHPLDPTHLALMQEQRQHMGRLEEIYTARLEQLVPSLRVTQEATLRFSIANGQRFNIMPMIFEKLKGQIDECCYTGTIHHIVPTSAKVYGPKGDLIEGARVRTEKLTRGFSISGDIGDMELLFDIAVDRERGTAHITSSFEEAYELEIHVQLSDHNRRVV